MAIFSSVRIAVNMDMLTRAKSKPLVVIGLASNGALIGNMFGFCYVRWCTMWTLVMERRQEKNSQGLRF